MPSGDTITERKKLLQHKTKLKILLTMLAVIAVISAAVYGTFMGLQRTRTSLPGLTYIAEPSWADTSDDGNRLSPSALSAATGYRRLLDPDQKHAYDDLEFALRSMHPICSMEPGKFTFDDVHTIYTSVMYDNPDILWCGAQYAFLPDVTGHVLAFVPVYLYDLPSAVDLHSELVGKLEAERPYLLAYLANRIDDKHGVSDDWVVSGDPAGDEPAEVPVPAGVGSGSVEIDSIPASAALSGGLLDRILHGESPFATERTAMSSSPVLEALEWLTATTSANFEYDHNWFDQTAAAFVDPDLSGTTVCAGYSKTFKLLCDCAGIECYAVIGNTYGDENSSHVWCLAYDDDEHVYFIDPTWGDYMNSDGTYGSSWCSDKGWRFRDSHKAGGVSSRLPIACDAERQIERERVKWQEVRDEDVQGGKMLSELIELLNMRVAGRALGFGDGSPDDGSEPDFKAAAIAWKAAHAADATGSQSDGQLPLAED